MRGFWTALSDLPASARWSIVGTIGVILALLLGSGGWALLQRRETLARREFAPVAAGYRQAVTPGQEASLGAAAESLKQFLKDYPRSGPAAEAWLLLGNVEYQRRAYDAAVTAFGEAERRGTGDLVGLSRLGRGYAWEAKGEAARALEVFKAALDGRDPKDFLYGELLLAVARAQESLKQRDAAVESYKRFLRDVPSSARADEVRIRLALLGAS